jgi:signal transduction histidine kinase
MSLRTKIPLILVAVIAVYACVDYIIQQTVILPSFQALERNQAQADMARCEAAVRREIDQIDTTCADWSQWDDAYGFVRDVNQDFIDANLSLPTFESNRLSMACFLDTSGKVVWSRLYDYSDREVIQDVKLMSFVLSSPKVTRFQNVSEYTVGTMATSRGILMLSARPILTSQGTGPIRGTLILGRFLDESCVNQLAGQTQLKFQVAPAGPQPLSEPQREILSRLTSSETLCMDDSREDTLRIYSMMDDVRGGPSMLICLDMSRTILTAGKSAARYLLSTTFAALGVLLVTTMVLLHRAVIAPVMRLTDHAYAIRRRNDLSQRAPVEGDDEIGALALSLNALCERLQGACAGLEQRVAERTTELAASNEQLRMANAELLHARQVAEDASRVKSEFLARMSHELRTPLNGIVGMTQLTLDTHLESEQREYLMTVMESASHLMDVVAGILDFSSLSSGKIILEKVPFSLPECVNMVVANWSSLCLAKGLDLRQEIAPDVPEEVIGDPVRLAQILKFILSNSVKFTEQGEILVRVETRSLGRNEASLLISVQDTGIGIPADKLQTIFHAFEQADSSMTRKYGGTGLGLTIAMKLVEMMGGTINVESQCGKGSVFHVLIPFELSVQPSFA